ncbi:protein of unknown function DUF493 [Desulfovibrio sp. X2]|uniref:DUF493 family protein n=1 Tax=Desulfovibrio sp. X2 TaxID=941449 RepID=UPI0003587514|nr:DUF493 family protein [Desulfovibrio sp. X2]EPR37547.1 protein of unknown function DUF493 [Desulfovibrio sp. X2]
MNDCYEKLQQTLEQCESWPCDYCFKFIVPTPHLPVLLELFQGFEVSTRESANGRYTSITANASMEEATAVVAVYRQAATIPGVISL